jgi:beta-phosphoglucomutase-like phosphatase (HAD superfamily)
VLDLLSGSMLRVKLLLLLLHCRAPPASALLTWLAPAQSRGGGGGGIVGAASRSPAQAFADEPSGADEYTPERGKFFGAPARFGGTQQSDESPSPFADLLERPDRLLGSDLNEILHPDYLDRLRFNQSPMEAYGAIFKWDLLEQGALELFRRPWELVAEAHGLEPPDDEAVMRAAGQRAERAIQGFHWTEDWGETRALADEHARAQRAVFREHDFAPAEGALEWLETLNKFKVPCCCASTLSLEQAEEALTRAGLRPFFSRLVTVEDGCETAEQAYLVSSLKVQRPPERCVVFEDEPRGVVAAHQATAKTVAVLNGRARGGELRHADKRVASFDELTLMSLKELFADADPR